jgi:hypothetical protein
MLGFAGFIWWNRDFSTGYAGKNKKISRLAPSRSGLWLVQANPTRPLFPRRAQRSMGAADLKGEEFGWGLWHALREDLTNDIAHPLERNALAGRGLRRRRAAIEETHDPLFTLDLSSRVALCIPEDPPRRAGRREDGSDLGFGISLIVMRTDGGIGNPDSEHRFDLRSSACGVTMYGEMGFYHAIYDRSSASGSPSTPCYAQFGRWFRQAPRYRAGTDS